MQESKRVQVALIGNPNSGKTSIFNQLTGLQQKVGNFPGVTVDKKSGTLTLPNQSSVELVDFPGAYSLYPTSKDERLVVQTFVNPADPNFPDLVCYVADVTRLEKHLLLFTQVKDLGIPVILILNMTDVATQEGLQIDTGRLSRKFSVPVISVSGRTGEGLTALKQAILDVSEESRRPLADNLFYRLSQEEARLVTETQELLPHLSPYQRILVAHHWETLSGLSDQQREQLGELTSQIGFQDLPLQVRETMLRYDTFTPLVQQSIQQTRERGNSLTEWLDTILTNRLWGPIIFFGLMVLIFQAIFAWASYPMDLIDGGFANLSTWLQQTLPPGWLTDLITDGLLAGLGGILVFIPQIAILFLLISLLEEVGYMARAAFMFDRVMQTFGLNGRSIVALISGGACAIPAIMSTRTISSWKERLITIMVTPFISCSARIPVYTVLIGFVVPNKSLGIFNVQGLAFMGLYVLGILAALVAALAMKWILRTNEFSFLMLELPEYRMPVLRNILLTVWEKVKTFTLEAGRIILIISIVLWVLASFGPGNRMEAARLTALETAKEEQLDPEATSSLVASRQIEASFAGHLGRLIEPAIAPLGFDWKMGIALITSFAAREVFVGTMATIYSIGSDGDELTVRERLAQERNPLTGKPRYDMATALSLLLFYVFAMQCMSTLAVVKRETKSWKWPLIQFIMMTGLAYLASLGVYQWLA